MIEFKSLCVFCGSSPGLLPEFAAVCDELGRVLAENNITLVYGGGKVGLMGKIADATLQYGGKVIGVIPQFLIDRELAHPGLTQLHIVESMHARKALMEELSDGFIILPGGTGSLEEFFEVWTWAQLGLHDKPVGFLNVNQYYDYLFKFLDHAVEMQFLRDTYRKLIFVENIPFELLTAMQNYKGNNDIKWMKKAADVVEV